MGKGLIYGALAGLGKGIYETNKMDAEQQQWDERQQKQQDFQMLMEDRREAGQVRLQDRHVAQQKDLEKWRLDTAETLRQAKLASAQERADARIAAMPNATDLQKSQILAEEGERAGVNLSFGYTAAKDTRDFGERKRVDDATIAHQAKADQRAAAAETRAKAEFDFTMEQKRELADITKKYRDAVKANDAEGIKTYGLLLGVNKDDKSTIAQLGTLYANLAKQSAEAGDMESAKAWRAAAGNLAGLGVAAKPGIGGGGTPKAGPSDKRPPLGSFNGGN